jgi:hypothetical protein
MLYVVVVVRELSALKPMILFPLIVPGAALFTVVNVMDTNWRQPAATTNQH